MQGVKGEAKHPHGSGLVVVANAFAMGMWQDPFSPAWGATERNEARRGRALGSACLKLVAEILGCFRASGCGKEQPWGAEMAGPVVSMEVLN